MAQAGRQTTARQAHRLRALQGAFSLKWTLHVLFLWWSWQLRLLAMHHPCKSERYAALPTPQPPHLGLLHARAAVALYLSLHYQHRAEDPALASWGSAARPCWWQGGALSRQARRTCTPLERWRYPSHEPTEQMVPAGSSCPVRPVRPSSPLAATRGSGQFGNGVPWASRARTRASRSSKRPMACSNSYRRRMTPSQRRSRFTNRAFTPPGHCASSCSI